MSKFGFGMNADMSRVNDDEIATLIMKAKVDALLKQIAQNESKVSSTDSASI